MTIGNEYYEWDSEKEAANIKKHGINFDTAILVFEDDSRIEWLDEAHSETEDRLAWYTTCCLSCTPNAG